MNQIDKTFWPASLAHLTLAYLDASSQYVTIAEISSQRANGYEWLWLLVQGIWKTSPRGCHQTRHIRIAVIYLVFCHDDLALWFA